MRAKRFTNFNIIACLVVLAVVTGTNARTIVNVDIYYETECGDSVYFIKRQFGPTYERFKDNLHVNYIPYGKAQTNRDEENHITFECQHGVRECNGNKAHACALYEILNTSGQFEAQIRMATLVTCAMSQKDREMAIFSDVCTRQSGFTAQSVDNIKKCVSGPLGNELLALEGEKTNRLEPRLFFVPTIVINGVSSQANQDLAISNFRQLICNHLTTEEREYYAC